MRIFFTIVVVCVVLLIISFSLQNASAVQLKYYNLLDATLPAYMLMFVAFLAGVLFTGLMGLGERLNLMKTNRQLSKTVRDLRREIHAQDMGTEDGESVNELAP